MNEIVKNLHNRKSVRKYEDKKIPLEIKNSILESALQAPTAGNQTLYTIIDVQSENIKNKLAVLCDNQPFIAAAPMVLVFVADCRRWLNAYSYAGADTRPPETGDLMLACCDTIIAAQNSVVAAESYGIGSCYIGDIMENKESVVELLELKPYLFPVAMVVYGYPTQQQLCRTKPARFSIDDIVCIDKYSDKTETELRAMFASREKDNFDFDQHISAFAKRKYTSDFSREMNRSVGEYIKEYLK